jgi:amino acid adenylation domain-containing protein
VSYVETHGTGTPLGDPVEVAALTRAHRAYSTDRHYCSIGSVKTNIGHLDAAAGVAGVIKTALALRHGMIPPSLNFKSPNPALQLETSPFRVNDALMPWDTDCRPWRAGISSFGIGGTNAHLVLEEPPPSAATGQARPHQLITLSARTSTALDSASERLRDALERRPDLDVADVAYTLSMGRRVFARRRTLVVDSRDDLLELLECRDAERISTQEARDRARVCFMFPGGGTQRVGMARAIYDSEPSFRQDLDRCAEILVDHLRADLRDILYPAPAHADAAAEALGKTSVFPVAVFVVDYALARLWMRWGVAPDALIGHSTGEYVAAALAGVFEIEDALAIVAERARLAQDLPPGAMVSVALSAHEVAPKLRDGVEIAAVNAPGLCLIAGPPEAVHETVEALESEGVECRRLPIVHASHSALTEQALPAFREVVARRPRKAPSLAFMSNVTGDWISAEEATDPDYWVRHFRSAVQFSRGIDRVWEEECILLEVGPGHTLVNLARAHAAARQPGRSAIASLPHRRNPRPERIALLEALGRLWGRGVAVDFRAFWAPETRRRVRLPTYPFERQRHWIDGSVKRFLEQEASRGRSDPTRWLYVPGWRRTAKPPPKTPPARWLVLHDRDALGQRLASLLEARGHLVARVEAGADYAQLDERAFRVTPARTEDHGRVLKTLREDGFVPDAIVHLWCASVEGGVGARVERGFHASLALARALESEGQQTPIRLGVVTVQGHDVAGEGLRDAASAVVLGPCKVIPQEQRRLRCANVDLHAEELAGNADATLEHVIGELTGDLDEPVVAYRGGYRWVQSFERMTADDDAPELRRGGTYLITGGLGAIGLALARHLARTRGARLALLGRSPLPPPDRWDAWAEAHGADDVTSQQIAALRAIEQAGGEYYLARADVTDRDALERAVADVRAHFGRIDGVFHGAGVVGGGLRVDTIEERDKVLAPKVTGTLNLMAALEAEPPDFVVLCSSIMAICPIGQADYAAASAFLDAFAQSRRGAAPRVLSIDFDAWRGSGMFERVAAKLGQSSWLTEREAGLSPEEGVVMFERALACNEPQVIVSTVSLDEQIRRSREIDFMSLAAELDERAAPATTQHARPSLDTEYVAPSTDIERTVAEIVEDVLGISQVGVHDNFFELGGHSLMATQVVSRLRRAFPVELALRSLFERPTVSAIAAQLEAALHGERAGEVSPIERISRDQPLPLSSGQQRLWFLDRLEVDNAFYNVPAAVRLSGPLDAGALERSLSEVARRHEALRTTFVHLDGRPQQVIHPAIPITLDAEDWRSLPASERKAAVEHAAREEARQPFDLIEGPLVRVKLLELDDNDHVLFFTLHHIIADFWSLGVLVREMATLYPAFCLDEPSPLPEPQLQYVDWVAWRQKELSGERFERQLAYWRETLAGACTALELPQAKPRPAVQRHRGAWHWFEVPGSLLGRVKELATEVGATPFMSVFATFCLLLHRYCGEQDILLGTPIANRTRADTEGIIGPLFNTLVLRLDLAGRPSYRQLLERAKDVCLGAYAHQDFPFERLVEELQPERDMSRSPLYQVLIALENVPWPSLELGPDLRMTPLRPELGTAKYDLLLSLEPEGEGLLGLLEYNTDLYDEPFIRRMAEHFVRLLESTLAEPDERIDNLNFLTDADAEELERAARGPATSAPPPTTVLTLVERWVNERPDAVAAVFQDQAITYREIDERADQLAVRLRRHGAGAEQLVGIFLERSLELVVAVLATMKAGAAFLPLDPNHPPARLAYIVEDARPAVVLTSSRHAAALSAAPAILCLDEPDGDIADVQEVLPAVHFHPQQLAYVIYTSGSTGRPKGVALNHGGLVNLAMAQIAGFGVSQDSRELQFASFGFDASVSEIFTALAGGATLYLFPQSELLPGPGLLRILRERGITVATLPPSTLAVLDEDDLPALTTLVAAGEACPPDVVRRWAAGRRMLNAYGPTETTVCATIAFCREADERRPPIGRPIDRLTVHVVDGLLRPVALGSLGEMVVSGPSLARGYLHRPELTAERFVPDPLGGGGGRLYRTGDVGRFRLDGELEFVGRSDEQVKLRGFRVELGEIEAVLREHPDVREAIAMVRRERDDGELVAYWVGAAGLGERDLCAWIEQRLPSYMVPSAWLRIERSLPRTATGKVDRAALPAPTPPSATIDGLPPKTPLEEMVAGVWREVLNVANVSASDNFFDLGGHSLLATRVVSRLEKLLSLDVPVRWIFEAPTLGSLATRLDEAKGRRPAPPLGRRAASQPAPLSFGQERLWFLCQLGAETAAAYNVAAAVRIAGKLEVAALQRSLETIVARHEVLRTRFSTSDAGAPQQTIADGGLEWQRVDTNSAPNHDASLRGAIAKAVRAPFDLSAGPLVRAVLLRTPEDHVLALVMHHIVTDAWSMGVLVQELAASYRAEVEGAAASLPELPIQYADYAAWQREWLEAGELERQLGYWREQLHDTPAALALPTDRARPAVQTFRGGLVPMRLSGELSQALRALSRGEGATLFMTLLAAFQLLLQRYSGQDDIVVGTPIANRTRSETERLIGFFVNTLALRTDLSGDPSFRELLGRVRETALGAYAHQDLPFERLVEELSPERDLSRSPLFQVMFVLQNAPLPALELGDLRLSLLEVESEVAKFDLTLTLAEVDGRLEGALEYNADLFDRTTAARMVTQLERLLESLAAEPEAPVGRHALLAPAEQHQLLVEWNDTATLPQTPATVVEMFEEQVRRTPHTVALRRAHEQLSYAELDARANGVAQRLRRAGVQPDRVVGLLFQRSPSLLVALLGVLKAGAAYLPLDPHHPRERLAYMLRDSRAPVLLSETRQPLGDELPPDVEVLVVDAAIEAIEQSLAVPLSGDHLAYVIYTSGSTGRPKGVMVHHAGVVNYLLWCRQAYPLDRGREVPLHSSVAVDMTVTSVLAPLVCGRTVLLLEETLGVKSLSDTLHGDGSLSLLKVTPAHLRLLVADPGAAGRLTESTPAIVVGGEALLAEDTGFLRARSADTLLINEYGPTETVVGCSTHTVTRHSQLLEGVVPIGRPLRNASLYVADAHSRPVPLGAVGELYVAGAGVARGYAGRPDLTAVRFVPHPFATTPGDRAYRTGDLARHRAGGQLEFLGRSDHQVKLRGHRIELGEIEMTLREAPGVRDAAVLAREDQPGDLRLVAYVAGDADIDALRDLLQKRLPDHMVPTAFVPLDALPLRDNGKVDRAALPAPEWRAARQHVAPRTELERVLADIWKELLGVDSVSIESNFFDQGGHSLLLVKAHARLKQTLQVELPLVELFRHTTIRALAEHLRRGGVTPPKLDEEANRAQRQREAIARFSPGKGTR